MLKNCPDPIDVQDIHFKLHCRLKLFENKKLDTFATPHSLIACASRYGLLFAGSISSLQAIQVSTLENYSPKDKDISDYQHRNIALPSNPKHISVNCDHTVLAVVIEQDNCPVAFFYDVLSFYKQTVQTITSIRLSANPGTYVTEIGWNPAIPAIFTACKSDGSLGIHELKVPSIEINEIPAAAEVSSFCWSPKGKQIAVGSKKGVITQYKPDLKAVRMISGPPLETPAPLISLQWVSNYQFIGVYQMGTHGAKLLVVDAPKTGQIVFTNYEDICYSGSSTKPQFFMLMQQHWNILLIASSNSAELAVMGHSSPDSWTQWIISDASRAELPLSPERQETLPIGLGLDISNTKPYPWGESTIPPCPYVLMLSHQGVLCIFDLVNLKNMPSICTPPDPIQDKSGLNEFQKKLPTMVPLQGKEQTPASQMPSVSVQNQNKQLVETTSPQLSFKSATSTAVPSNIAGLSFSSQVTSSTSKATNLFSFAAPTSTQAQSSLFGASQMQPTALFGGQSSITPIKMQSSAKPLLEDISITPISKTQQSNTRNPSDDKYSSIFSALSTPQNTVSLPVQVKPIVVSTPADKTVLEKKMGTPSPFPKSDMSIGYKTESNVMSKTVTKPVLSKPTGPSASKTEMSVIQKPAPELSKVDTEAILQKMIKEDCISLEAELKMLSQKTRAVNINLGSESDKVEMLNIIQNLEEFLEEISEISIGEHSEIHTLKQNLVLSWAWYEEALSRYNTSKDDMLKLLIKSQPLDSATEKRYTDIKKLIYYIESQLLEVSKALDEQWDKFQDYVKKTYRVQMPTMEAIYQAMVRQNAVLQKQGYIMKDISSQLKKKKRSGGGSLLLSMDNVHLEDQLRRLQLDHQDIKCQQYENAVIQSKRISSTKSKKLQLLLKNREVVHVTTIKSFIPSETFQSPNKRLSLLGAKMSPVARLIEPKQIDFSPFAPSRNTNIAPVSFNSTQIENQSNKPLTFGKAEITSSTTTNKVIPLTKSGLSYISPTTSSHILSSNLPSAFAPTTQLTLANKDKIWSYPVASSNSQVPSTIINPITTASTYFSFASSTNLEINKPISSISKEAFSNKSISPSFSFINTSISSEVTPSNILVTPAKSKDILFGSGLSKLEKPITISTGASSVTSAFVTKTAAGFSATNTGTLTNISTQSTTIKSPTISFGSTTIKEPVAKSVTFTSPVTTASIFSSQLTPKTTLEFTSFAITKGSNNITVTSPVATHSIPDQKTSSSGSSSLPKSPVATVAPPTSSIAYTTISAISSSGVSTPSTMVATGSLMTTTSSLPSSTTSVGTSIFGTVTTSSISVTTATTGSIFASSTAPSLFGSSTDTMSSNAPLLVSKTNDPGSLFGTSAVSSATSLNPVFGTQSPIQSASSIFGTGISTTTTTGSIFGSSVTSGFGKTTVTSSTSAFGPSPTVNVTTTTTSPQSVFISSSQGPAFGESTTASSTTSIFANISKVDSTVKPSQSIFGSANAPQTSIFGQPTTVSSTNSVFGSSPTTSASIFGSTPTTTQTSLFGSTPTTTQTSIFAPSAVTTTQSSPTTRSSIFGNTPTTTTTQTSIFASTTVPTTQSTFFGGPTSQASLFGSSGTTSATTHSSIFGSADSSITKPVFGSTTSSASIFASTVASNSSPFGQTSTTTFGSGFGGTSTAPISSSSASMFGQQSPSVFGSNTGSIFGGTPTTASGSIFGNNTTGSSTFGTVSSSGNLFGTPATSSFSFASTPGTSGENALNFGGLNVGSSTTTSGSIFGGGTVFGSPATGTNANPFGRAPENAAFGGGGNLFANPAATTASVFGASSTFGTNNQSSFGSSIFGSPGFGQQQQQQPAFGQNTFGSTGTFGNTTAGPFSGGTGVAQSGFGSPTAFQKPSSGFGSAPAFGGSPPPAFGGSPSFGGAPAFGAAPAFGSPTKVFGSNTPTAAFGSSSSTGSPGFGNLANQNTIGFGNLAKQTPNSASTAFSGNSSFSSWR